MSVASLLNTPNIHHIILPDFELWTDNLSFWENDEIAFNARVALSQFFKNRKPRSYLYIITSPHDHDMAMMSKLEVNVYPEGQIEVVSNITGHDTKGKINELTSKRFYYNTNKTVDDFVQDINKFQEEFLNVIQPPDWMRPF